METIHESAIFDLANHDNVEGIEQDALKHRALRGGMKFYAYHGQIRDTKTDKVRGYVEDFNGGEFVTLRN